MYIAAAELGLVMHRHLLSAGAVQNDIPGLRAQLPERRIQAEVIGLRKRNQHGMGKAALILRIHPSQNGNGALVQGQALIRNHQCHIKLRLGADTEALRAGTEGIVEGKAPGLDLLDADATVRAGKAGGQIHRLSADHIHGQQAVRQCHRLLDRLRKTLADALADHQTVHHDLDGMPQVLFQLDFLRQIVHISIDAHPHIAGFPGTGQHLLVHALLAPDNGCQELNPGALRQAEQLVHHFVHRLPLDLPSAFRAVGNTDSGVEKPEIIIDLRHRSHRRTGIPVG